MPEYKINDIVVGQESKLTKGFFIYLQNIDKVPPHLGIVLDGKNYSLSACGKAVGDSAEGLLRLIYRKKTKVLFFSINNEEGLFTPKVITQILEKYTSISAENTSCLTPIKDFFSEAMDLNTEGLNFIFNLLPELYRKKLITEVQAFNMEGLIQEGSYAMRTYTFKEINERIRQLQPA